MVTEPGPAGPFDLEIVRTLKAPRAKVWRAFADPAHLKEWWCPKPWTTEVRAFDLRPGGGFHTYLTGPMPDGTHGVSDNPGCFLEIAPMERIVSTSALGAGWRPIAGDMPITSMFLFADEGEHCRLTARCMHLDEEGARKHAEMGFFHGWGLMIDQWEAFARELV